MLFMQLIKIIGKKNAVCVKCREVYLCYLHKNNIWNINVWCNTGRHVVDESFTMNVFLF